MESDFQNLPIDIHYNKLHGISYSLLIKMLHYTMYLFTVYYNPNCILNHPHFMKDWLVSRRHCKDDWHETNARLSKEGARLLVRAHEFSFFQETQYADCSLITVNSICWQYLIYDYYV